MEEVPAGAYTEVQLRIGHGCDGSPTTKVEVQVPESVVAATPFRIAGWDAASAEAPLDPPVDDGEGGSITERTSTVTWTATDGNVLPDHQVQDFGISVKVPDQVGEVLYFKTIQTCEQGSTDWITEWDGKGEEPEHPAPAVTVIAAEEEAGHGGGEATTTTEVTATEGASSSDDGSDGGSSTIAIVALVAGLGGLALGGAAFAKGRKG